MNKYGYDDQKKSKSLQKIKILMNDNNIEGALKIYSKLHKSYPNDMNILLGYGKILTLNEKTKQKGIKILKRFTNSTEASNKLKQIALDDGDYELAIEYCKRSLETSKDMKNVNYRLYDLGQLYKKIGNYRLSKVYFKKLLDTHYRSIVLLNLLYIEILLENYNEALNLYNICLDEKVEFDSGEICLFLKSKLDILTEEDIPTNYYESQILNYSDIGTLKFLKKQLINRNLTSDEILVEQLYSICKEKIKAISPDSRTYVDKYVIDIDGIPFADTADVITLNSTKQIINIYTYKSSEKVKNKIIKND